MIRGIHHVAIHTRNLDKILDFYREAFGFVPVTEEIKWGNNEFFDSVIGISGTAGRLIMLKASNVYLEIFEYSSPQGRQGDPLRPNDLGYTHFCVDTDDIEEDYKRLIAAGMKFTRTVPDEVTGIRAVYGQDPEGNVIELQQVQPNHAFAFERVGLRGRND